MEYELIKSDSILPFRIFVHQVENFKYHWHKELEIILTLNGYLTFSIKNDTYTATTGDIILINSNEVHSLSSSNKDNAILVLQIETSFFKKFYPNFDLTYFDCNSIKSNSPKKYNILKKLLAKTMLSYININNSPSKNLDCLSSILEIISFLVNNFITAIIKENDQELYRQSRIMKILDFINKNYASDLTLTCIAEIMHLNPQYISKFFKNSLGVGFVEYVNQIRIKNSLHDLLNSQKGLLEIALAHGFNDHKSYNRVFKREYNVSPSEYRKNAEIQKNVDQNKKNIGYINYNSSSYFKYLLDYNDESELELTNSNKIFSNIIKQEIEFDFNSKTTSITKNLGPKLINIGRAALLIRNEIQLQLKAAKKDINFEYIRFPGIFSDELMVYNEDCSGNPVYNWTYLDEIFDFLMDIKIQPFIEIGFMPIKLSSNNQQPFFNWDANVSFPKSINNWCSLVREFMLHWINRYGLDRVNEWYFEIWNEPDLENVFWYDGVDKFFIFFKETFNIIKGTAKTFKIGTPGLLPQVSFNNNWADSFFALCVTNNVIPDFFSFHSYDDSELNPANKNSEFEVIDKHLRHFTFYGKKYLNDLIAKVKTKVVNYFPKIDFFITEWNSSPLQFDLVRDTAFMAPYIIYNLINNINKIQDIGFWTLSDIFEEKNRNGDLFHGGFGLVTYNGLKKPSYNALMLVNKLKNQFIDQGDNYIICKSDTTIQILIFNFAYYNNLYKNGDVSMISEKNRSNIFEPVPNINIEITINNLPQGTYSIKYFQLDCDNGSIFDAWLKIGAPDQICQDTLQELKKYESPSFKQSKINVDNKISLSESLPIHGVILIEIAQLMI